MRGGRAEGPSLRGSSSLVAPLKGSQGTKRGFLAPRRSIFSESADDEEEAVTGEGISKASVSRDPILLCLTQQERRIRFIGAVPRHGRSSADFRCRTPTCTLHSFFGLLTSTLVKEFYVLTSRIMAKMEVLD